MADSVRRITVGDPDNDNVNGVYGIVENGIYKFDKNIVSIGSGKSEMRCLAIGDTDINGRLELYGANCDRQIFQFKWDEDRWKKEVIGRLGENANGVAVGDGDNNGTGEVYGVSSFAPLQKIDYTVSEWKAISILEGSNMEKVACGDGDQDGIIEVYTTYYSGNLLQLRPTSDNPIITLKKKVDKSQVWTGGIITYTITYANEGSGTATNVTIIEVLPEHCVLKGVRCQVSGIGIMDGRKPSVHLLQR